MTIRRLTEAEVDRAVKDVLDKLDSRLKFRNRESYRDYHRVLPVLHSHFADIASFARHDNERTVDSLQHIAVAAIIGAASLHSNQEEET